MPCDLIQYYKDFNNITSLNNAAYFIVHQSLLSLSLSLSSCASSSILIKPFKRPNYVLSSFSNGQLTAGTRFR